MFAFLNSINFLKFNVLYVLISPNKSVSISVLVYIVWLINGILNDNERTNRILLSIVSSTTDLLIGTSATGSWICSGYYKWIVRGSR